MRRRLWFPNGIRRRNPEADDQLDLIDPWRISRHAIRRIKDGLPEPRHHAEAVLVTSGFVSRFSTWFPIATLEFTNLPGVNKRHRQRLQATCRMETTPLMRSFHPVSLALQHMARRVIPFMPQHSGRSSVRCDSNRRRTARIRIAQDLEQVPPYSITWRCVYTFKQRILHGISLCMSSMDRFSWELRSNKTDLCQQL